MSEWSKETYEASISSRCWWCTSFGDGWAAVSTDRDMKGIVTLEQEASPIPTWAEKIVESSINFIPPCGHYLFPQPQIEVIKAIGFESPPQDLVHGCYTVERERKDQMQDYCLCLDAWLAGAKPTSVARELSDLGRKVDWEAVCVNLWDVLGEHTEAKELLVQRLLHHLRWWTKFTLWDSDWASQFGRDQYLGDYSPSGGMPSHHCYFGRNVPGLDQQASPRVQKMEARLAKISPLWEKLRPWMLDEWWLCAPKAFRFLERTLWHIGKAREVGNGESVPDFLQVADTCPNEQAASEWWQAFREALWGWYHGAVPKASKPSTCRSCSASARPASGGWSPCS